MTSRDPELVKLVTPIRSERTISKCQLEMLCYLAAIANY